MIGNHMKAKAVTKYADRIGIGVKPKYTLSEVAKITGMSRSSVYRAAKSGALQTSIPEKMSRGMMSEPEWIADWLN